MTNTALLEISDLHACYGPITALRGVSLQVFPGEIVSLIGANGAGKSTTLMCISGIQPVQKGEIIFDGMNLVARAPHDLVQAGLSQVPEGRKIFPRMTVQENLELGAYTRGRGASLTQDYERIFALFPVLCERRSQAGGTLSGGEQQMLAIGRALMSRPKLLLLDEPSMGIAPLLVKRIFETIKVLNSEGMTILLVEQNAHAALELSHRGYVLETGVTTCSGSARELLLDPRVREAYLGDEEILRSPQD